MIHYELYDVTTLGLSKEDAERVVSRGYKSIEQLSVTPIVKLRTQFELTYFIRLVRKMIESGVVLNESWKTFTGETHVADELVDEALFICDLCKIGVSTKSIRRLMIVHMNVDNSLCEDHRLRGDDFDSRMRRLCKDISLAGFPTIESTELIGPKTMDIFRNYMMKL